MYASNFFVEAAIKWTQWFQKEESLRILNIHYFLFSSKKLQIYVPITNQGDGDREGKEAAQAHEGREDLDARVWRGEMERNGPRPPQSPSPNGDQQSGAMGREPPTFG